MKLLIASDLSARSDVALQRAMALAGQLNAEFLVLHVIDSELPQTLQSRQKDRARDVLHQTLRAGGKQSQARVLVRSGHPSLTIGEVAEEHDVDLVVLGSYRKEVLKDTFIGTTAERVMRASRRPVLMVNQASTEPYQKPMIAVDFSSISTLVLQTAKKFGVTTSSELSAIYAVSPENRATESEKDARRQEAQHKLRDLLTAEGITVRPNYLIAEEGEASSVIRGWARRTEADLLIMGTSGMGGVRRMFIGSVAGNLLREMECDMLAVPAPD